MTINLLYHQNNLIFIFLVTTSGLSHHRNYQPSNLIYITILMSFKLDSVICFALICQKKKHLSLVIPVHDKLIIIISNSTLTV